VRSHLNQRAVNSRIWLGALACVLAVAGCSSSVSGPGATATSAATSTTCLMVPASTVPGAPFESEVGCSDGSGTGYLSPPAGTNCTADRVTGTVSCSGPVAPDRTTASVPPPAVLPADVQALRVKVPFSADQGTLVLVDGPAPEGMAVGDAEGVMKVVLTKMLPGTNFEAGWPRPDQLLSGLVTLAPGTGAPPLDAVPAWVMIYPGIPASCAPSLTPMTYPPAPTWASGLHAIIVTNPDPSTAIVYYGAGTSNCSPPRSQPVAVVGPTSFE